MRIGWFFVFVSVLTIETISCVAWADGRGCATVGAVVGYLNHQRMPYESANLRRRIAQVGARVAPERLAVLESLHEQLARVRRTRLSLVDNEFDALSEWIRGIERDIEIVISHEAAGRVSNPLSLQRISQLLLELNETSPLRERKRVLTRLQGEVLQVVAALRKPPEVGSAESSGSRAAAAAMRRRYGVRSLRFFSRSGSQNNTVLLDTNVAMRGGGVRRSPIFKKMGTMVSESVAAELAFGAIVLGRSTERGLTRQVMISERQRASPAFEGILSALEGGGVGGNKGFLDRQVVAEALMISEGTRSTTFVSGDRAVYSRLVDFALDPRIRRLSPEQVLEEFGANRRSTTLAQRGFWIEIEGRRLRVVPFSEK